MAPNPSSDFIQWDIDDFSTENVKIYDLSGVKLLEVNTQESFISVQDLSAGAYVILVSDGKSKQYISKFIKE